MPNVQGNTQYKNSMLYKKAKSELNVMKELKKIKKNIFNVKVKNFKKVSIKEFIKKC